MEVYNFAIINDDDAIAELMAEVIIDGGHAATCISNITEYSLLQRYSAILIDINAFEALEMLRTYKRVEGAHRLLTPIILTTRHPRVSDIDREIAAGVIYCPVDIETLLPSLIAVISEDIHS